MNEWEKRDNCCAVSAEGGGIASRGRVGGGEGEWHALKFNFKQRWSINKTKTITHLSQFCGAAHESVTLRSCCSSLSL